MTKTVEKEVVVEEEDGRRDTFAVGVSRPYRRPQLLDMPEKSGSYPGTCFWLLINIQKRPIEFFVPYSSQPDFFVQDKKFQIFPL